MTQSIKTAERYPIVRSAAASLTAHIHALNGHQARHILAVIVEDLTTYPTELGNAVAVLRIIERNLPTVVPPAARKPASEPDCICGRRGYCADVAGDPMACPACVTLRRDDFCKSGARTAGAASVTP